MELAYTIKRSEKRRKLTITVERDRSVVVHAPADASDEVILRVVESKRLRTTSAMSRGAPTSYNGTGPQPLPATVKGGVVQ